MQIDQHEFDRIASMIHSDSSPVGIDAKKTHIYIIHLLETLQQRVDALEKKLAEVDPKT